MTMLDKNGRELEVEISHGGDSCDSYVEKATYVDDASDAPDEVCEWLTEHYASEIQSEWFEHQVSRADFYSED